MHPEFQHDTTGQRLSEQFRQMILSWNDLDEQSRKVALARSEELANLLAGLGSEISADFFVMEISEEEFVRLLLTETFQTTSRFLTLLNLSFSSSRKLAHELESWILLSKDEQEFYLSNLEKVVSVLPEKSDVNGITLIAIILCGLEAHRLNRRLVEQVFAFLRDNPELAPVISEAVAFSYYDVVNPRLAAPRSLYLGYLSFVFNLILDLSSKAIDSRLLEALIHSQDYWLLIDKVTLPESTSEQELTRQTLAEILVRHERIFTSTTDLVELFPDFVVSLTLNPLFYAKPKFVEFRLNKAVEDFSSEGLSREELAHGVLSLAVCYVGSVAEWVFNKVSWPVRKEFLDALVRRCRNRKFNSSCYKIFNTFFYDVSYCPTWREDPWSLLKLTESYLRLAFLEICEELAIYVSNKPWNSTISSDVELQKIVSVALNSLKKFDRNDQYGPSQALFRYLASIVNTLQTLRLKNFSKTEIACSISVLFLKSNLGRGLSLTTVSINIVGEFIRQLLQEIPEIATAILTDKYNLSQLLNLALYAIFGPFLDELSRNDAENGHSEDEIFEECKRQLSNCGFFECLKKVVLSIDAFSSEVHKGSNSGDNSVDACTLIERKLINLLKGFMLATECKSSQDQHQVLRRAFVSEFYLQYLSHNDCPYSEYSILWPNVVGLGCQLTSIVSRDDDFKSNFEKIVECLEKFLGTAFEQTLGRDQVELTLDWILQYLNLVITPERLELGSTVNVEEIVNELSKFIKARFEPGTFSLTPKDINPPQVYLAAINCGARFSSYFDSRKLYSLVEVYPPYGLESVFSEEETFECFILGQDSNARIVNLGSHDLSEIEKYLNPGGFEKANKRYEDWIRGMPENATFLEIFDRLIRHVSFKQGTQITAEHISHQKPEQNLADEQTRIITAALLRYFNDRLPHLVTGICHDRSPEAQQEIYSYLSSAEQVVSHSLEQLEQNRHLIPKDLQPSFETVVDTLNSLADHIQEQLRKCKTEASCTSKARFRLVPRKDPIDCWYGFLGDCCITDFYGNELSRSDFQPIRIMDDRGYIVGYVYVVIAEVEGRLSFVVAGIEPNYLIKTRIDYGSFVEGLLGGLVRLSKRVKVDGRAVEGVYVNAGYKGERDDGRISQLSQVRDAIRKLGKEYLRELDRPVQFPYTYFEPISYVYDISSVGIIANLANYVE